MSMKWFSVLLIQLCCYFSSGTCGKVLVWPTEYSHWINVKTMLDELVQRGHEVTVLTSSASILIDPNKLSAIKFEVYPTSLTKDDFKFLFMKWVRKLTDLLKDTFWTYFPQTQEVALEYSDCIERLCKDVVFNKKLMLKLQESRFDIIFADAIDAFGPCGELLAELLKIPFVYSVRFTYGYTVEKYSGGLLTPPTYVPIVVSELHDQMTFMERVKNMMYLLYFDFWFWAFKEKKWDQFYSEVLGRRTTLFETMGKSEVWLITYWDFEFPRPFLHFDFVGGLYCKPANPLPKEIEEFVQSSGTHGVVVFTLGSMVSNITEERANTITSALAQIPQKVLWYDGKKPDTLGSNTRLYKWIPQNDLLGHPKTKAFITHGGTNGIYEAIYHGIPMVGIPLFVDQPDNLVRMKAKGAAVSLDTDTVTSTDLLNALKTVINDPFYKENAVRLSAIHHDQPVRPLDQAVFWMEFVMYHKGAKHLRPATLSFTWYQYHSLDVIGFLLACVAIVTFLVIKRCLFGYRKCFKTGKKKKRE
ncbi:LOW QUALITY PROTEIN: UDP-glucuronosyltransferase 2B17-like [Dugong dugon]